MARTATKKAEPTEAAAAPAADEVKATRVRTAQKLTMSQTKVIEAQFDTRIKDANALDGKLVEILDKFNDNHDTFVPTKIVAARQALADGIALIELSKAEFAEIGEKYRSFFG